MKKKTHTFQYEISSVLPGRPLRASQAHRLDTAVNKEIEAIQDEENLRYGQEQLVDRIAALGRIVFGLGLIVAAMVICVIYMMTRT